MQCTSQLLDQLFCAHHVTMLVQMLPDGLCWHTSVTTPGIATQWVPIGWRHYPTQIAAMKVADVQLKTYAVSITTRSILGNVKMPFVLPIALTDTGVGTMATTGKPITRRCYTITGCKARVYSRMAIIATGITNGIFAAHVIAFPVTNPAVYTTSLLRQVVCPDPYYVVQ